MLWLVVRTRTARQTDIEESGALLAAKPEDEGSVLLRLPPYCHFYWYNSNANTREPQYSESGKVKQRNVESLGAAA